MTVIQVMPGVHSSLYQKHLIIQTISFCFAAAHSHTHSSLPVMFLYDDLYNTHNSSQDCSKVDTTTICICTVSNVRQECGEEVVFVCIADINNIVWNVVVDVEGW